VLEPPLDLLAECRQQLRPALASEGVARSANVKSRWLGWWRWGNPFEISTTRWSAQVAAASLLIGIGFISARLLDHGSLQLSNSGVNQMGILGPTNTLIRDIQPGDSGRVRIVVDQESEISGRPEDANIRSLLLSGARQPESGVRFYAMQLLNQQNATVNADDVRQVLLDAVHNDPNPAVRLEALDGLRRFSADPMALESIKFVLEHDDNASVRYQAINILVPPGQSIQLPAAVAQAIQDVLLSAPEDDYIRARCSQALHEAKTPLAY